MPPGVGLRGLVEAVGVVAEGVEILTGPVVEHLLSEVQIGDRAPVGGGDGGSQPARHDDDLRRNLLEDLIGPPQRVGIEAGVGGLIAPLQRQIRLVPDLDGIHTPHAQLSRQIVQAALPGLDVVRVAV